MESKSASGLRDVQGKGTEAIIDGKAYWIGSHRFMHEKGAETEAVHEAAASIEEQAHTLVAIGSDEHVCGLLSVSDKIREEAPASIARLKKMRKRVVMLTGDNEATAKSVADSVGVSEYNAELLPEDKVRSVESLVSEYGHVAMIGDGVNDAPAMAVATLSIAMGAAGTDAAIETADIALMSDDLSKVPWLINHSNRTSRTIKQNIGFALGVKLLFMVLAVSGLATLWMAIAADMGASLVVIFNGLRLLRRKGVLS
jgi:Cd2+/Zn2+-exporting ATPase